MPRRCDRLKKMLFIKIPISFTSLIPSLILPSELRKNSESTPQVQKVLFVKIGVLKRLTLLLNSLTQFLKKLAAFLKRLTNQFINHTKNHSFFAQSKIIYYLCTVNLRWGCLHISGEG